MTEDDGSHRRRRRHARPRRIAVLLVGLLFLFTPAAAYVSGVRATEIENRRLSAFPSASAGWDFFPRLSAWATDHLPLRDRAVAANTRLSEAVFGEPPQYGGPDSGAATGGAGPVAPAPADAPRERAFPEVLQGDDWLFYGADVEGPCDPVQPVDEVLEGADRFGRLLQRAGKRYVFTVAPDKSYVHPERLPDDYVGDDCAPQAKREFWERLRSQPPAGYVELERELARVEDEGGESLWRPSDSHWSPRGGLVYAERVAQALDPQLWRTSRIVPTGPVQLSGDLASLLGTPRRDEVPGYRLERDGVTVTENSQTGLAATSTGAPLWEGPTLLLGDSFTQNSRDALAPLFASARIVHPVAAQDVPDDLVEAIRTSDTVVLEIVERAVEAGELHVGDPDFLRALERALLPAEGG
jgi:alginate O-acetyltransferase complex protein AlgJ